MQCTVINNWRCHRAFRSNRVSVRIESLLGIFYSYQAVMFASSVITTSQYSATVQYDVLQILRTGRDDL